jgi:hypothetical protein
VQRQLGNAVPLELGKVVVRFTLEQLGYLEPSTQLGESQMRLAEAVA